MRRKQIYPFVPKSTSYMLEGQFWDIPLSNGKYACGRVLQFDYSTGKKDSRSFLAGLLDWTGEKPPDFDSIAGAKLLIQGNAHIKTIPINNGYIRGHRPMELDSITPLLELSHMPGNDCWLQRGYERLRLATLEERKTLYTHSSWGLGVIAIYAELYFVKGTPPVRKLPWDDFVNLMKHIGTPEE